MKNMLALLQRLVRPLVEPVEIRTHIEISIETPSPFAQLTDEQRASLARWAAYQPPKTALL